MGDRTAIQFKNGDELSPVLKGQNVGKWLVICVDNFMEVLKNKFYPDERVSDPITRREPSAILVMFILKYLKNGEANDGDWRLLDSEIICQGTDNGHWIVDLKTMKRYRKQNSEE